MKITKTKISGLTIIEPKVFSDNRGYFFEPYNNLEFEKHFGNINFVQDNESKSVKGVLRGFHFQKPPFDQAKLVRCVTGKVLDIAVDLRKQSKTFGKFVKIILSDKNKKQFFIPRGFAHGFLCLSKICIINYKCNKYRDAKSETTLRWDDSHLKIKWPVKKPILSLKDKRGKNLNYFK